MNTAIYDIPLKRINGDDASLGDFRGKVMLAVNVASKCGLTPQYEGLEKLHAEYGGQGLVVAGFPANDFAGQEPGSDGEIAAFCKTTFGIQFPMFAKIVVTGAQKHPLYDALTKAQPKAVTPAGASFRDKLKNYGIVPNPEPEVLWNFEKFLLNRKGEAVQRFSPDMTPDDPALLAAIKAELAK